MTSRPARATTRPATTEPPTAGEVVGHRRTASTLTPDELPDRAAALLDAGLPARAGRRARRQPRRRPRRRCGWCTCSPPAHRTVASSCTSRSTPTGPHVPSLAGLSFPAGRFEREMRDLFGIVPDDHPLPRRLVRHFHWPRGWYPMLPDAGDPPAVRRRRRPVPVPHRRGRRGLRDPGRPGARRHDRARATSASPSSARPSSSSKPGCGSCTAASRSSSRAAPRRRASSWPNGSAATPPSGTPWRTARPSRTPDQWSIRDDAQRRRGDPAGARTALQPRHRHRRAVQRRRPLHPQRPRPAHPRTAAAHQRRGHRPPAAARRRPSRRRRPPPAARPRRAARDRRRHRRGRRRWPWTTAWSATGSPAPPCSPPSRPATSARSATSPAPAA